MQNEDIRLAAVNIGDNLRIQENTVIGGKPAFTDIGAFVSSILPNIYVIAGIIVFIIFIIAGLMYIFNAGKGDAKAAETSQKALTAAIIGLVLIFASFWIIQIVEIVAGFKILDRQP